MRVCAAQRLGCRVSEQVAPRPVSLAEARKILRCREQASRDLAARSTLLGVSQAASDEAATLGGIRSLLDELELARTRLHGDPLRPLKRLRRPVHRVVIVVDGGALTQVLANGQNIEAQLVDYDVEDLDDAVAVPQTDGTRAMARLAHIQVEVDAQRVEELFHLTEAPAPESQADTVTLSL